jgi:hypothetical protein
MMLITDVSMPALCAAVVLIRMMTIGWILWIVQPGHGGEENWVLTKSMSRGNYENINVGNWCGLM